jgi:hypothetical protein
MRMRALQEEWNLEICELSSQYRQSPRRGDLRHDGRALLKTKAPGRSSVGRTNEGQSSITDRLGNIPRPAAKSGLWSMVSTRRASVSCLCGLPLLSLVRINRSALRSALVAVSLSGGISSWAVGRMPLLMGLISLAPRSLSASVVATLAPSFVRGFRDLGRRSCALREGQASRGAAFPLNAHAL